MSTDRSFLQRINNIYAKIDGVMSKLKNEEVKFSSIVEKWDRGTIVDTFMPIIYLDHEKKVQCRQDQYFDEIFIRKLNGHANGSNLTGHSLMPQQINGSNSSLQNNNTVPYIKSNLNQSSLNTQTKSTSNSQNQQPAHNLKTKSEHESPKALKLNIKKSTSNSQQTYTPKVMPDVKTKLKNQIKSIPNKQKTHKQISQEKYALKMKPPDKQVKSLKSKIKPSFKIINQSPRKTPAIKYSLKQKPEIAKDKIKSKGAKNAKAKAKKSS